MTIRMLSSELGALTRSWRDSILALAIILLLSACQAAVPVTSGRTAPTSQDTTKALATSTLLGSTAYPKVNFPTVTPPAQETSAPQQFSVSTSNHSQPEDVIQEVAFGGAGAGDGGPSECFQNHSSYSGPVVEISPADGEIMEPAGILTCGWQHPEELDLTIGLPNGTVRHEAVQSIPDGEAGLTNKVWIFYNPRWNDPSGEYTFTLKGADGKIETSLNFRQPNGARVYLFGDVDSPTAFHDVILYQFSPNEKIRLFAFEATGVGNTFQLVGWKQFQVDTAGSLSVHVEKGYLYGVIGDITGGVPAKVYSSDGQYTIFTIGNISKMPSIEQPQVTSSPSE
jgi:hypothetical protein